MSCDPQVIEAYQGAGDDVEPLRTRVMVAEPMLSFAGMSVSLGEQSAVPAPAVAHRAYVLEQVRVALYELERSCVRTRR